MHVLKEKVNNAPILTRTLDLQHPSLSRTKWIQWWQREQLTLNVNIKIKKGDRKELKSKRRKRKNGKSGSHAFMHRL